MTPLDWVLVILGAWIFGIPALIVTLAAIRGACRKLRARLLSRWPALQAHHPGLPRDGEPLTPAERRLMDGIEFGYRHVTAGEPGGQR